MKRTRAIPGPLPPQACCKASRTTVCQQPTAQLAVAGQLHPWTLIGHSTAQNKPWPSAGDHRGHGLHGGAHEWRDMRGDGGRHAGPAAPPIDGFLTRKRGSHVHGVLGILSHPICPCIEDLCAAYMLLLRLTKHTQHPGLVAQPCLLLPV